MPYGVDRLRTLSGALRQRVQARIKFSSGAVPEAPPVEDLAHALFSDGSYHVLHPDVRDAGLDGLDHFRQHGEAEGRTAHPLFDPRYYRRQVSVDGSPLLHYLGNGRHDGASPHRLFDPLYYVRQAPEAATMNPLVHFVLYGGPAGLSPCPLFDPHWYLRHNRDVARTGLNALVHYASFGWRERRTAHPLFDAHWYVAQHPEVGEDEDPLAHFLESGRFCGFDPSPFFSTRFYVEEHPEAASHRGGAIQHFLDIGLREGAEPSPEMAKLRLRTPLPTGP